MTDINGGTINLSVGLNDTGDITEIPNNISPSHSDVSFFESQLNSQPDAITNDISKSADTLSDNLKQKKLDFELALSKASSTSDPNDVLAAARSLSEYSIQTSIVAKAAGKSSQAVDKLTNLQ